MLDHRVRRQVKTEEGPKTRRGKGAEVEIHSRCNESEDLKRLNDKRVN